MLIDRMIIRGGESWDYLPSFINLKCIFIPFLRYRQLIQQVLEVLY